MTSTQRAAGFDGETLEIRNLRNFRWRSEDAHRNALNGHCYWRLRAEGLSVRAATKALLGLSVAQKNELLCQRGSERGAGGGDQLTFHVHLPEGATLQ